MNQNPNKAKHIISQKLEDSNATLKMFWPDSAILTFVCHFLHDFDLIPFYALETFIELCNCFITIS